MIYHLCVCWCCVNVIVVVGNAHACGVLPMSLGLALSFLGALIALTFRVRPTTATQPPQERNAAQQQLAHCHRELAECRQELTASRKECEGSKQQLESCREELATCQAACEARRVQASEARSMANVEKRCAEQVSSAACRSPHLDHTTLGEYQTRCARGACAVRVLGLFHRPFHPEPIRGNGNASEPSRYHLQLLSP